MAQLKLLKINELGIITYKVLFKNIECPASFILSIIKLATYKTVLYTNTELGEQESLIHAGNCSEAEKAGGSMTVVQGRPCLSCAEVWIQCSVDSVFLHFFPNRHYSLK